MMDNQAYYNADARTVRGRPFDPEKTVSEFVQMFLAILHGCFRCADLLKLSIMVSEKNIHDIINMNYTV